MSATETDYQNIWREIDQAKRVLLTFHPKPDPDSVGSCLGLASALRQLGHEVTVIKGDSPLPDFVSILPGYERIVPKTIWEVAPDEIDLFLVLDLSRLDRLTDKPDFTLPSAWRVVCLDHHQGSTLMTNASLIETTASATAVLVYDLLKFRGVELSHDIAANLLIGIYGDTGSYRYARVDSALLAKASDLLKFVPDYPQLVFALENNLTPEAIRFEALALAKVETHGGLALSAVSFTDLTAAQLTSKHNQSSYIANKLKSVNIWLIGACLVEESPNFVRISLRTRDAAKYDLAKLAEGLGGGGHKAAAGAAIKAPLPEAKKMVLAAVQKLYPEII